VDEAIDCYHKALKIAPKYTPAPYNLGIALMGKGKVDEAIECYRQAVELDPKYAEAHCNLGHALREQGRFAEALAALKRGDELGSQRPDWPYRSADWVKRCQVLLELDGKLAAVLTGTARPESAAQRLEFAALCAHKKQHAAAARFYAEAFAEQPQLAAQETAGHRYSAARLAALAGCGKGVDADKQDGQQRARWRRQALTWLRAELTLWTRLFAKGEVGRSRLARTLAHWHKDANLAGLRDKDALDKLSAEERAAVAKLWADVATLLKKAETPARKRDKL
jgi:serine/threonine-protein kinase